MTGTRIPGIKRKGSIRAASKTSGPSKPEGAAPPIPEIVVRPPQSDGDLSHLTFTRDRAPGMLGASLPETPITLDVDGWHRRRGIIARAKSKHYYEGVLGEGILTVKVHMMTNEGTVGAIANRIQCEFELEIQGRPNLDVGVGHLAGYVVDMSDKKAFARFMRSDTPSKEVQNMLKKVFNHWSGKLKEVYLESSVAQLTGLTGTNVAEAPVSQVCVIDEFVIKKQYRGMRIGKLAVDASRSLFHRLLSTDDRSFKHCFSGPIVVSPVMSAKMRPDCVEVGCTERELQATLEAYYLECGFKFLKSRGGKGADESSIVLVRATYPWPTLWFWMAA
jgi:hypothetical protein